MKVRALLGAVGIMAVLGSTAGVALAQNQTQSNLNLYQVAGDIGTAIMTLERDQQDYGEHRAREIGWLRKAHKELRQSEKWAASHGYGYTQPISPAPPPYHGSGGRYVQSTSNQTVVDARNHVPNWIAQLQSDNRDYGGHRAAAIGYLQNAETELNLAIQWFNSHGGH